MAKTADTQNKMMGFTGGKEEDDVEAPREEMRGGRGGRGRGGRGGGAPRRESTIIAQGAKRQNAR